MSNKLTKINYKKPLVFKYKNLNINLEFKQLSIFLLLLLVTYFGDEFYIILDKNQKILFPSALQLLLIKIIHFIYVLRT